MNKSGDRGLTSAMRRISKEKPHAGGEGVVGVRGGGGSNADRGKGNK